MTEGGIIVFQRNICI